MEQNEKYVLYVEYKHEIPENYRVGYIGNNTNVHTSDDEQFKVTYLSVDVSKEMLLNEALGFDTQAAASVFSSYIKYRVKVMRGEKYASFLNFRVRSV